MYPDYGIFLRLCIFHIWVQDPSKYPGGHANTADCQSVCVLYAGVPLYTDQERARCWEKKEKYIPILLRVHANYRGRCYRVLFSLIFLPFQSWPLLNRVIVIAGVVWLLALSLLACSMQGFRILDQLLRWRIQYKKYYFPIKLIYNLNIPSQFCMERRCH